MRERDSVTLLPEGKARKATRMSVQTSGGEKSTEGTDASASASAFAFGQGERQLKIGPLTRKR